MFLLLVVEKQRSLLLTIKSVSFTYGINRICLEDSTIWDMALSMYALQLENISKSPKSIKYHPITESKHTLMLLDLHRYKVLNGYFVCFVSEDTAWAIDVYWLLIFVVANTTAEKRRANLCCLGSKRPPAGQIRVFKTSLVAHLEQHFIFIDMLWDF